MYVCACVCACVRACVLACAWACVCGTICSLYAMLILLLVLDNVWLLSISDADNILFLKYEDMKKDLPKTVETIASFIGYKLEPQVVDSIAQQCTFQSMKENPSTNYFRPERHENAEEFFRKGSVGDWKHYFTEEQNERFDKEYDRRMHGIGLEFDFELEL